MSYTNLDVYSVQCNPSDLDYAMSKVTESDPGTNLLITNAECAFELDGIKIQSRQFDTMFMDKEILVLLQRGGGATADDIRRQLDDKNIEFSEIELMTNIGEYQDNSEIPDIWLARDDVVLYEAFDHSRANNTALKCDYYPNLEGNLSLNYLTNNTGASYSIDGRIFKGLLHFEDKLILLIDQKSKGNLDFKDTMKILKESGIETNVVLDGHPELIEVASKKMV